MSRERRRRICGLVVGMKCSPVVGDVGIDRHDELGHLANLLVTVILAGDEQRDHLNGGHRNIHTEKQSRRFQAIAN